MVKTERSPRYYYTGPTKKFPTANSAQRQAEWFAKCLKSEWEQKGEFISAEVKSGNGYYFAVVKHN